MLEPVRSHWGLGSRLLAEIFVPSGGADERESFARFQRKSATAEVAGDLLELTLAIDVSEEAARLRTPTLVVHRRGDRAIRFAAGEELAVLAPNAELLALAGDSHVAWFGDTHDVIAAMAPFLGIAAPVRESGRAVEELSARERDVLRLVAEGLSDADIAGSLVELLAADARAAGITHLTATMQSSNSVAHTLVRKVSKVIDIHHQAGETAIVAALNAA